MRLSRRSLLASVPVGLLVPTPLLAAATSDYRDPKLPIAQRVSDLLGRMTLDEKIAQLRCLWFGKRTLVDAATGSFSLERARSAHPHGIGQVARPSDTAGTSRFMTDPFRSPGEAISFINSVQRYAVEHTRLGIPVLFHEETAHGLAVKGATMLPSPPGLGSTWDPELVEQGFALVGRQARLRGITLGLSPVVDLIRDPRWGRVEEFFGEDTHHVAVMGEAAVRGLQGPTRPIAADRIFATLKHYVHGSPQNGLNVGPADMSERMLREVYLPPFTRAVRSAHAAVIMPSYNEVAGIPAHANTELLQRTGRELIGFQGAYFSDYNGVRELASLHKMAANASEAATLAINAGVDVDLPEGANYALLADLVREGKVEEKTIDAAVSRVLAMKFEAGLFENPYADPGRAERILSDPAGPALARKLAQRSIVLLKNKDILPLDPNRAARIAVIGPNSREALRGGYSGEPKRAIGILEGLRAAAGPQVIIEQADGVWITAPGPAGARPETIAARAADSAENRERIKAAVGLAERSDIVILCVGDNEVITREAVTVSLPGDRSTLELYGDQNELVKAVLDCGKPVIAVLINGRPLVLEDLAVRAAALVEAWYPGEQGGHAIADILFGKVNPGGKLPVGFPASVGELPSFYSRHPSADKVPYVEGKRGMLFPFGFGLSYTSFTLSKPRLSAPEIGRADSVKVEVEVTNTGPRTGDEVVQIYVRDLIASVPRPVLELRAFRRVTLKKGEARTLSFELNPDDFAFWDRDMNWRTEPGEFAILAGNSSDKLESTILRISADG